MRFLAGVIIGALGVMAYQKKDELKESAKCFKDKALNSVKGAKEGFCCQNKVATNKKAK